MLGPLSVVIGWMDVRVGSLHACMQKERKRGKGLMDDGSYPFIFNEKLCYVMPCVWVYFGNVMIFVGERGWNDELMS